MRQRNKLLEVADVIRFRVPENIEQSKLNYLNSRLEQAGNTQTMFWDMVEELIFKEQAATKEDITRIETQLVKIRGALKV